MPDEPRSLRDPPPPSLGASHDDHELLDARPTRYLLLYTERSGMTLDRAAAVLRESGFTLTPGQRGYRARCGNGLELRLAQVDRVAALATVHGACDDDAVFAFLDTVDAVIEVAFDNLEQALDEANTLIESQMQLQAASNGLLVMCWNRVMQLPE